MQCKVKCTLNQTTNLFLSSDYSDNIKLHQTHSVMASTILRLTASLGQLFPFKNPNRNTRVWLRRTTKSLKQSGLEEEWDIIFVEDLSIPVVPVWLKYLEFACDSIQLITLVSSSCTIKSRSWPVRQEAAQIRCATEPTIRYVRSDSENVK
jgi:hypothetical protein